MNLTETILQIIGDNRKKINDLFNIPKYLKQIAENVDSADSRLMAIEEGLTDIERSVDDVAEKI